MAFRADMLTALGGEQYPSLLVPSILNEAIQATDIAMGLDVMQAIGTAWAVAAGWIRDGYGYAPALMLGLATLLAVPPLAVLGLLARRRRAPADDAATLKEPAFDTDGGIAAADSTNAADGMTWPVDATIEVEGTPGARFPIGREMLRIGRDDDNDLVLRLATVHRFHAVIQRTEDAEIVVVDLSGADGNGVRVNGQRVARARLRNQDLIELGDARLRFDSRRA